MLGFKDRGLYEIYVFKSPAIFMSTPKSSGRIGLVTCPDTAKVAYRGKLSESCLIPTFAVDPSTFTLASSGQCRGIMEMSCE